METKAKLIYKTDRHNFPTKFPAHFYGMPDNTVYVIYSRPYKTDYSSGIEFFFGLCEEFFYNYQNGDLYEKNENKKRFIFFEEFIDKYGQKIKMIKVSRKCETYLQAESILDTLFMEQPKKNQFICTKPTKKSPKPSMKHTKPTKGK